MTAPSSIEIEIHTRESCIVTLRGEHAAASREGVTLALALARDYTRVIVDLTPCTSIDATVLTALLASAGRMQAARGALEVVAPRRAYAMRRALWLAGVLPRVRTHTTRSEAIAAITAAEERLRPRNRPVSLRAVIAEIEHINGKAEPPRATPAARPRRSTVLRARVEDSVLDADDVRRRRAA